MVRADMLADLLVDYRDSLIMLCYNPQFSMEMLDTWASGTGDFQGSSLKTRLDNLERFLSSSPGTWCAGENITFVDFLAWEILDHHRILVPGCLQNFVSINLFMESFENLENVRSYIEDPRYKKFPIWSPRAKYGYF